MLLSINEVKKPGPAWKEPGTVTQAWREIKRQARGHHSPSSIQGQWLAKDDQKNNSLASLCLASYLPVNWFEKLKTKHCVYYAEVITVLTCVFVCVWYLSLIYL